MSEQLPLLGPPTGMQRLITGGYSGLFALLIFGHFHLECVRSAPGAPARCTGASYALIDWSTTLEPFTLEPGSVRLGTKLGAGRDRRTTIVTPGGVLASPAVGFVAREVVDEAERFRADDQQLAWRREKTTWGYALVSLAVGVVAYLLVVVVRRRSYLVLDRDERLLRRGRRAWALDAIDSAEPSYMGRGSSDLRLIVNGVAEVIAGGDEKLVEAAAKQINAAR
jgi:hypothetical protein